MVQGETGDDDLKRFRAVRLSRAHSPPRFEDDEIPTLEQSIVAVGGPGKPWPRAAGSWPWIAGSFTLGSNKVWNIDLMDMQSSSPNMWWLLRHSHSGTNSIPGGTFHAVWMNAQGNRTYIGDSRSPIRSVRGPGTIYLYGVGGRKNATGSVPYSALPTAGTTVFAAMVRGHVE